MRQRSPPAVGVSDDEARRLVNACDPAIRPLLQAALLTGARYSELAGLEVRDFDRQSQTIWLRETKAGVARAVYLEGEGVQLFEQATLSKESTSFIFPRPDGRRWGPSQQARPLATACIAAKLAPTGFHDLRRTYGARLERGLKSLKAYRKARNQNRLPVLDSGTLATFSHDPPAEPVLDSNTQTYANGGFPPMPIVRDSATHIATTMGGVSDPAKTMPENTSNPIVAQFDPKSGVKTGQQIRIKAA